LLWKKNERMASVDLVEIPNTLSKTTLV